jgi:hypothetical protein
VFDIRRRGVIDAHDVDGPGGLVDPVDHLVGAAPCGVVSG